MPRKQYMNIGSNFSSLIPCCLYSLCMSQYTPSKPIHQQSEYQRMAKKPKSKATTSGFQLIYNAQFIIHNYSPPLGEDGRGLHIKSKVHDVSVLNDVFLTFYTHLACLANSSF